MLSYRSANPAFSATTQRQAIAALDDRAGVMTVAGTINKTFVLSALAIVAAGVSWKLCYPDFAISASENLPTSMARPVASNLLFPLLIGGAIAGLVLALVTCFATKWVQITAPLYALAEGVFLGAISGLYEARYGGGIVIQAGMLTMTILVSMLMLYRAGIIRATPTFRTVLMTMTMGIFLLYLASFVLSFFGVQIPYLHAGSAGGSSALGIGISVVIAIVASLNLILDFDYIERGAQAGHPKKMEWYGAFGLLVTLVWVYLEMLRLLAKIRGSSNN